MSVPENHRIENAAPKRAALRLAAMLGGVAATVGMLAVASHRLCQPVQVAQPPVDLTATSAAPTWTTPYRQDIGESFRFPAAYEAPPEPVAAESSEATQAEIRPAESEELPFAPVVIEVADGDGLVTQVAAPGRAAYAPPGALTIDNPAALGPPEEAAPPAPRKLAKRRAAPEAPSGPIAFDSPPVLNQPRAAARAEKAASPRAAPSTTAALRTTRRAPQPDHDGDALTYTPSAANLSRRLESDVQAAFQLGKAGAVYAARAKFVEVLRRIASAKDAEQGAGAHAAALADGLRTLEDADDFIARGDALEAEMDVASIARSHSAGLIAADEPIAAHDAIARYSQHAAARLAEAAAGEPAGSMALYGLGKTYARLEAQSDDPSAGRKSAVMYRAAMDTHPQNYLAANELGVRLAKEGRYEQAEQVLRQAARQPSSIAMVHANLASVERLLGQERIANATDARSERLAQAERATGAVSRRHGVQWMAPDAFRRATPGAPPAVSTPPAATVAGPVEQPSEGGWNGWVQSTKRLVGWSSEAPSPAPAPPAGPRLATPQRVVR